MIMRIGQSDPLPIFVKLDFGHASDAGPKAQRDQ
jgi:hypothetical protein